MSYLQFCMSQTTRIVGWTWASWVGHISDISDPWYYGIYRNLLHIHKPSNNFPNRSIHENFEGFWIVLIYENNFAKCGPGPSTNPSPYIPLRPPKEKVRSSCTVYYNCRVVLLGEVGTYQWLILVYHGTMAWKKLTIHPESQITSNNVLLGQIPFQKASNPD
jgi:hypothetical protein